MDWTIDLQWDIERFLEANVAVLTDLLDLYVVLRWYLHLLSMVSAGGVDRGESPG